MKILLLVVLNFIAILGLPLVFVYYPINFVSFNGVELVKSLYVVGTFMMSLYTVCMLLRTKELTSHHQF